MKYYLLKQSFSDRGRFIPVDDDPFNHINNQDIDWYISIFQYNEKHFEHFKKSGSVAGITDVTTSKLVWDFDSETNVEAAKTDALELCSRLTFHQVARDDIQICFSGSKGFSVQLKTNKTFTPDEFRNINLALAKDLSTNDTKITNANRIFRLHLTRHNKTRLYKIPLTLEQLSTLSIDQIRKQATSPHVEEENEAQFTWSEVDLSDSVYNLKLPIVVKVEKSVPTGTIELDFTHKAKFLSNCKFALLHGHFEKGNRNNALIALASTFKNQGFPKEITYRMLKGAAELQAERTGDDSFPKNEIWNTIVKPVYSASWKGGQYTCKSDGWLKDICNKLGTHRCREMDKEHLSVTEIGSLFKNYATNIEKNTIKTGIKALDENVQITVGMSIGLLGSPGCHAKGTKVLMFDGSTKKVEDVIVGDLLMGPDSKSREVLKLCYGKEEMVKINPLGNKSFIVNKSHILHLAGNLNIKVSDYIQKIKCSSNNLEYKLVKVTRLANALQQATYEEFVFTYSESKADEYYGFTLDKDHLYLTDDFFIHHNSGKTSLALNILNNTSKNGINAAFFSMDMYHILVLQKLLHRHTGMTARQLYELCKDSKSYEKLLYEVSEEYKNVDIYYKSGYSVEDIKNCILDQQERKGEKVKLAVIDYLECIHGPYSDSNANTAIIANQLKDLANSQDITVLTLLQPQKSAGDPSKPLLSMRQVKGASTLEQSFSTILGIYREGFNPNRPQDDQFITVNSLKNRMGGLFSVDCLWNGLKGEISEITPEGQDELNDLRLRIKQDRAQQQEESIF